MVVHLQVLLPEPSSFSLWGNFDRPGLNLDRGTDLEDNDVYSGHASSRTTRYHAIDRTLEGIASIVPVCADSIDESSCSTLVTPTWYILRTSSEHEEDKY